MFAPLQPYEKVLQQRKRERICAQDFALKLCDSALVFIVGLLMVLAKPLHLLQISESRGLFACYGVWLMLMLSMALKNHLPFKKFSAVSLLQHLFLAIFTVFAILTIPDTFTEQAALIRRIVCETLWSTYLSDNWNYALVPGKLLLLGRFSHFMHRTLRFGMVDSVSLDLIANWSSAPTGALSLKKA